MSSCNVSASLPNKQTKTSSEASPGRGCTCGVTSKWLEVFYCPQSTWGSSGRVKILENDLQPICWALLTSRTRLVRGVPLFQKSARLVMHAV